MIKPGTKTQTLVACSVEEGGEDFWFIDHGRVKIFADGETKVISANPPSIFVSCYRWRIAPNSGIAKDEHVVCGAETGRHQQPMCMPVCVEYSDINRGPVDL